MRIDVVSVMVVCLSFGCSDQAVENGSASNLIPAEDGKNDTVVDGEESSSVGVPDTDDGISEFEGSDGGIIEGDPEGIDGDGGVHDAESDIDEVEDDPFAEALDVTLHRIQFPEGTVAPDYLYPRAESFRLGGTEFWQKWEGGQNPTYSYSDGSEAGKRCMYASARRFEAIMADAPESLLALKENSNWGGSFFNWNDDFTGSEWGDGRSARLWAWRTSLVKWISQTNRDGSCFVPTLEMVESFAESCGGRADSRGGEIQGCSAN